MFTILRYNGKYKLLSVHETESFAMAKLFALQNTKGKGYTRIEDDDGLVLYEVEGQGNGCFPKVTDLTKATPTL